MQFVELRRARLRRCGTFLRIHRGVLVDLGGVRDLTAVDGGRFVVSLKDAPATTLHASRAGARLLREKLGF